MINNIDTIKKYISEIYTTVIPKPELGVFHLSVISNKKTKVLKHSTIIHSDLHDIYSIFGELIDFCTLNNARLYINLNPKNLHNVNFELAQEVIRQMDLMGRCDSYKPLGWLYYSILAKSTPISNSISWFFDWDSKEEFNIKDHVDGSPDLVHELFRIETPNGYHIHVEPFNRKMLVNEDMLKINSLTVAFAP